MKDIQASLSSLSEEICLALQLRAQDVWKLPWPAAAKIVAIVFAAPLLIIAFIFRSVVSTKRASIADAILLLVCRPDEAEAIVGDLAEELKKVRRRHSAIYSGLWFYWALASVVVRKSPAAAAGLAAVATMLWRRS